MKNNEAMIIPVVQYRIKREKVGIPDENAPLITGIRNDIICGVLANGEVAQLVEHHVRNVGVESSNLFFSTISKIRFIAFNDETFFCFQKPITLSAIK